MALMRNVLLPLVLTLLGSASLRAERIDYFIASGHPGGVLSLAADSGRGILVSGGGDGVLRFWKEDSGRPAGNLRIGSMKIVKIILHPKYPQAAVVETDGLKHFLSVWDIEKKTKKFTLPLTEVSSIFQYSPQGTFIIQGRTDWKSLLFFDSQTGRQLPYLSSGFGIVSFAMLSSTENTLVSYTPSTGTFIYWNLKQGTRKQTIQSQPDMKNLVLFNERYVVGILGSDLAAVDMVTGLVTASRNGAGISSIVLDPKTGDLGTLGKDETSAVFQKWKFRPPLSYEGRGMLFPGETVSIPRDTAGMIFGNGERAHFYGKAIVSRGPEGRVNSFGEHLLETVTDIVLADDSLNIVTPRNLYRFSSDFFSSEPGHGLPEASYLRIFRTPNPFSDEAKLLTLGDRNAYLWKTAKREAGEITAIDPIEGRPIGDPVVLQRPLREFFLEGDFAYTLEDNGMLRRYRRRGLAESAEYTALDLDVAVSLGSRGILGGTRSGEGEKATLVLLDPATGNSRLYRHPTCSSIFSFAHDKKKDLLYYTGFRTSSYGRNETLLMRSSSGRIEAFTTLASADFFDYEASMFVDDSSTLYLSIGNGPIRALKESAWKTFEADDSRPIRLFDGGGRVFGIKADGSLTAWDKKTGKILGRLYLFLDGTWFACGPTGSYITDRKKGELENFFAIKEGKELSPAEIEDYRLELPGFSN